MEFIKGMDISMVKELEYDGASYQEFFPVWRPVCNRTDTGAKTPQRRGKTKTERICGM